MHSPNRAMVGSQLVTMSTSMRVNEQTRVIFLIRQQPSLTRTQISRLTGLSKATGSNLLSELLVADVLNEGRRHGGSVAAALGLVFQAQESLRRDASDLKYQILDS